MLFSFVAQFGNDEISCRIELQPKVTLGSLLQLFVVSENKLENCEFTLLGSFSFQHVLTRIKPQKKLVRGRNRIPSRLLQFGDLELLEREDRFTRFTHVSTAEFFCTEYYCYVCVPPVVWRK